MPTPALAKLGRRIRLGLVGGGGGALIGPVHRVAAHLDECFEIVAGTLSSNPEKSLAEAVRLGIPRGYADMPAMIAGEAARSDGIHELAAASLDAGLDVICDKPLTNDLVSSLDLVARAKARKRLIAVTHNYSGYPMIREARAAIAAGEIGPLRVVHAAYVQGSLGTRVEDDPAQIPDRLRWRLDPKRGGLSHVLGDIGTHVHQLVGYVAGKRIEAVLADVGAAIPGRSAHDTASVIVRLEGGARGVLFVTKAATGAENAISIEAYGEAGGIYWHQAALNELRVMRNAKPAEIRTRGLPSLHPLARAAGRIPAGHPEAFFEAFANIYRDFAELVAARRTGMSPDPMATTIPMAEDGADGIAFVEACIASTEQGKWVDVRRA